VTDEHLDRALFELMVEGGDLTKAVLGVQSPGPADGGRRTDC
jgi:hypothetical protein